MYLGIDVNTYVAWRKNALRNHEIMGYVVSFVPDSQSEYANVFLCGKCESHRFVNANTITGTHAIPTWQLRNLLASERQFIFPIDELSAD